MIVREPVALSTSVSFRVTAMKNGISSVPVCVVSLKAIGASFKQVIVILPVAVFEAAGQKLSLSRNVKVSIPQ